MGAVLNNCQVWSFDDFLRIKYDISTNMRIDHITCPKANREENVSTRCYKGICTIELTLKLYSRHGKMIGHFNHFNGEAWHFLDILILT